MGMSASKVVKSKLRNSSNELNSACDSVYNECLNLTRHCFGGVLPYQLTTATKLLHSTLILSNSLIAAWLPLPPTRLHIDNSLRLILSRRRRSTNQNQHTDHPIPSENCATTTELPVVIGLDEFKEFAVEVFTCAVVDSAQTEVVNRVKIGMGGIVGVGIVTRSGTGLVGAASGAYALFVAASVYLALSA